MHPFLFNKLAVGKPVANEFETETLLLEGADYCEIQLENDPRTLSSDRFAICDDAGRLIITEKQGLLFSD